MEFHDSVHKGIRDVPTVTAEGQSLESAIEGVKTFTPKVHPDHRGRVFEFYSGPSQFWTDPVVFGHIFSVRPGVFKSWGLHEGKDDRYTLVVGEVLVVLWDARATSGTCGNVQKIHMSADGVRQILIPAGVWHASVNVGSVEAFILDMPTKPYVHGNPDKIRLDASAYPPPVNLADFLPPR